MNNKSKNLKTALFTLLAFLLSAGSAYGITTYLYGSDAQNIAGPVETPPTGGKLNIDPSAPRTAECPINGEMYTEIERKVWETRRPLFVMIENSVDARPQSGLNEADIIYEAVAEGGISRFGAVYYCGIASADTILGPVRSARTHFVNWASEYNDPIYVHVGGANCSSADGGKTCLTDKRVQALEQIASYGWNGENDFNQFSIGFPTFWRDYERLGRTVATEHTMYTSTEKLYKYAADDRGWTNLSPEGDEWIDDYVGLSFKDEASESERGSVNEITFNFWNNKDFVVTWNYDAATNTYSRTNGGVPHKDLDTDEVISAKAVVVQFIDETGPVDTLKHIYYDVISSGDAIIFQDGKATEATWSKSSRESRTIFKVNGKEVEFNRGKLFIEGVPTGNDIEY